MKTQSKNNLSKLNQEVQTKQSDTTEHGDTDKDTNLAYKSYSAKSKNSTIASSTSSLVDLSVVLPVYKEAQALKKLVPELIDSLEDLDLTYEIIFVNLFVKDDPSYEVLTDFARKNENIFPVDIKYLRTNANTQKGEQYRLGFALASGKYVIQMDSDYQDSPQDLHKFVAKLEEGYDLVVGWKQDRKDPFFYKLTSKIQNSLTRFFTGIAIHDKNCGFKGYSRAAVESLRLYGLNFRDIPIQLKSRGFSITEVPIINRKRNLGENKFDFKSRLIGGTVDFLCDLIMSKLEDMPFRFWAISSVPLFVLSFLFLIFYLTESSWSMLGLDDSWLLFILFSGGIKLVVGFLFLLTGLIMQYTVDQKTFDIDEYYINKDYKNIIKKRLS